MHFTPATAAAILLFCNAALAAPVPQIAGEGSAANSILSDFDNAVGYGVEDAEDNLAANIDQLKSGQSLSSSGSSAGSGSSSGAAPPPPPPPHRRRQIAGEGSAANSILSDFDNAVGYGVEDAEDNLAKNIDQLKSGSSLSGGSSSSGGGSKPPPPPPHRRRQIAGEGSAADSILSDFDNAVGYGVEDAEDNLAGDVTKLKGGSASSGGSAAPPPPPPHARRQLDKISNGFKTLGDAAGISAVSTPVGDAGDQIDGELTNAAAQAGAQVGQTEESVLEGAGSSVPKQRRQLDKISNGFKTLGDAAGISAVSTPVGDLGDQVDGELTNAAAQAGAEVGQTEESVLEGVGSSVPKVRRQLDKISNGFKTLGDAAGISAVSTPVGDLGDQVDGELTNAAAQAGAEVGQTEESVLEGAGSSVPRK